MVGSYLNCSKGYFGYGVKWTETHEMMDKYEVRESRTYVSSKEPLTKELVSDVLPTARNPRTATFLWTSWGSFLMMIFVCCYLLYLMFYVLRIIIIFILFLFVAFSFFENDYYWWRHYIYHIIYNIDIKKKRCSSLFVQKHSLKVRSNMTHACTAVSTTDVYSKSNLNEVVLVH